MSWVKVGVHFLQISQLLCNSMSCALLQLYLELSAYLNHRRPRKFLDAQLSHQKKLQKVGKGRKSWVQLTNN